MEVEEQDKLAPVRKFLQSRSIEDLAKAYAEYQRREDELVTSIAERIAKAKIFQKLILEDMNRRFNADGTQNSKVAGLGTFYVKEAEYVGVADWDDFHEHLRERVSGGESVDVVFGAFNKAISKDYVKLHMDKSDGLPPPGVKITSERKVIFRKESGKGSKK